jgi:2,3-bisphosphoglycerate-independent phosphoglycerate mutase
MANFELIKQLSRKTDSKILYIVIDGLGDLPHPDYGNKSPLESAQIPNLDNLAANGSCGLTIPVLRGITPGSGPAHLSLFGYDPLEYEIGRGVLSALGIGVELRESDVAARVNFCTVDKEGNITDRRAGRIPTEVCAERCSELSRIEINGVEILLGPEMEYRASLVLRGKGLGGKVSDTDPQILNVKPLKATGSDPESKKTAAIVNEFTEKAGKVLGTYDKANMILLRGFDQYRKLPLMQDVYKLNPACIATYPMYKGVTRLLGMTVLDAGETIQSEFETLKNRFNDFDFFYLHIKKTDSAGEDGDFLKKVHVLEELDKNLSVLETLNFSTVVVCGDHSTPCAMKSHSWHPVPFILSSPNERPDDVRRFTERECVKGVFGTFPAKDAITLTLAAAGKLNKFGA